MSSPMVIVFLGKRWCMSQTTTLCQKHYHCHFQRLPLVHRRNHNSPSYEWACTGCTNFTAALGATHAFRRTDACIFLTCQVHAVYSHIINCNSAKPSAQRCRTPVASTSTVPRNIYGSQRRL